jgi:hypothetical protein
MSSLSKSKLVAFRQCPKRLWLEVHRPDLREDSPEVKGRFKVGYEVGAIARKLYDEAGLGHTIDFEAEGFEAAFARSAELLATSQQPVFEAGFKTDDALALADVMIPEIEDGQIVWRMVEVKLSTSVKNYHRDDLAVQAFVAHSSGIKLKSIALAHLDRDWVYPGDGDYRGLLKENDLTAETIARADEVRIWIADAQSVVRQPCEPVREIGAHCSAPFPCGFHGHCSQGLIKPEHPLNYLPRFRSAKRERLAAEGIVELRDVPDDLLSVLQHRVKVHTLAGTTYFDGDGAAADLAPYGRPAYFLDFESVYLAVPRWKGTQPYQQIPFQFSLHTVSESGQLAHTSFLDLSGSDPSEPFAEALIAACGDAGPVFVYSAAFESTRIAELSSRFAKLAEALLAINQRIVDLLPIARKRYYHPSQCGSWSIKNVLPAVLPEMSYAQLDGVQNGGDAMEAFREALNPATSPERKCEIEKQLLAYCCLDTSALVRLWQLFSGFKQQTLNAL